MPGRDDFYVGYRPIPAWHRRFLKIAVPAMLWCLVGISAAVVWAMRDPGPAVWKLDAPGSWRGTVVMDPYPMLVTDEGPMLLVSAGKFGAHDRVAPLAGRVAEARGFELSRAGGRMIELLDGDGALSETEGAAVRVGGVEAGRVTVRGEIVDGKCFLGAMKPGDGKGHKSCAVLCIRGGLPAMLIGSGEGERYLLRWEGSAELPQEVLDLVAEPVEAEGVVVEFAGVRVLDASDLRALGGGS